MTEVNKSRLITLLHQIAPHSQLQAIEPLKLGFSNRSFQMRVIHPDDSQEIYVVKQYSTGPHVFGQDAVVRAEFEYQTLTLLRNGGIPCPEPIFFDPKGVILGTCLLVTKYIPGAQIMAHPSNPLWAAQAPAIADLLARIHMLRCPTELVAILPNATTQATWFFKNETMPDYLQAYPDGELIWNILREETPKMKSTEPVLVHGDYWSGNMLWESGQLTGILDWENVSFGDPGFDIANCRMEMIVDGMDTAADTFFTTYEMITGNPITNLGLCELAVAVQPMWQRAPFLLTSPFQERFRQFVANAQKRL